MTLGVLCSPAALTTTAAVCGLVAGFALVVAADALRQVDASN